MPKERAALLLQSLCAVIFSCDPVGVGVPYASQVMVDTREVAVDIGARVKVNRNSDKHVVVMAIIRKLSTA